MSRWCESILGVNFEAVKGKQVLLEWTETSGGLLECWQGPGVPLAFLVESDSREFFRYHAGKGSLLSSYESETGLLWMWAGLSCFLSSGDGNDGELLELQQGSEGPFEVRDVSCNKP